jgi:hypothetical protein
MWLRNFFFRLFHPSYWIMLNRYDRSWDKKLNELLDKGKFSKIDRYTAELGGIEIWVANYPYASMVIRSLDVRPSCLTIKRAHTRLIEDRLASMEGK